eukprot:6191882-Pleurochrysis_carterae.AAC.1
MHAISQSPRFFDERAPRSPPRLRRTHARPSAAAAARSHALPAASARATPHVRAPQRPRPQWRYVAVSSYRDERPCASIAPVASAPAAPTAACSAARHGLASSSTRSRHVRVDEKLPKLSQAFVGTRARRGA